MEYMDSDAMFTAFVIGFALAGLVFALIIRFISKRLPKTLKQFQDN